ncbi:MAG: hypothetical protein AAGG01_17035, partial [Planctomycetota bacterium]
MELARPIWALSLLASSALTGSIAFPQDNPCPEPVFFEAWVDPLDGDNTSADVGNPNLPYRTINAAIFALEQERINEQATPDELGLVHCLPGIYTDGPGIGSQSFPISMRPYIHVQGAGAKECVLRVRPSGGSNGTVLWPLSTGLTYQNALIAVDFRRVVQEGQEPSMLDGFTIQGADVQVYLGSEFAPVAGRVSSCVFDMRHGGAEMLEGPYFGALVGSIFFGEGVAYQDHELRLFNNTFIQGASYGSNGVDLARASSVAIANCCDPTPGLLIDPIMVVRGVNDLHIQNNLIRCLDEEPRTAMLGIDQGDTQVIVSSRGIAPYDTNAFASGLVGGISVDGTFSSAIWDSAQGFGVPAPVPAVDLGPEDPGFVGEYLSDLQGEIIRDHRILPDSLVVDQGATPFWAGPCAPGIFTAGNGRVHADARTAEVISSFDYDGDGHGNERVIGADIDIGFDEFGQVTVAGSYGNDTKSHFRSYDPQDYLVPSMPRVDSAGVPLIQVGTPDR